MNDELVEQVLGDDSDDESSEIEVDGLRRHAVVASMGIASFVYAILGLFAPSTVAVFGLPTAMDVTAGIWGTVIYWWLVGLSVIGFLMLLASGGSLVSYYVDFSDFREREGRDR